MKTILAVLCLATVCVGCRTPSMADGTLRTGDTLRVVFVTMHGRSDTRTCVVDESGLVRLPFIGNIRAAGSTTSELDALALKMYQDAALHIGDQGDQGHT